MSYLLEKSGLITVDKEIHNMIHKLIQIKNEYEGPLKGQYNATLHILDLLQYCVIDTRFMSNPRSEIESAKDKFKIAKVVLDKETIDKIQYVIDFLEPYVQAWELIHILK